MSRVGPGVGNHPLGNYHMNNIEYLREVNIRFTHAFCNDTGALITTLENVEYLFNTHKTNHKFNTPENLKRLQMKMDCLEAQKKRLFNMAGYEYRYTYAIEHIKPILDAINDLSDNISKLVFSIS